MGAGVRGTAGRRKRGAKGSTLHNYMYTTIPTPTPPSPASNR
jgi:hypothetical protein